MGTQQPGKIYRPGETAPIDLGQLGARVAYDCRRASYWSFQTAHQALAWPTGTVPTLTATFSNDGVNFAVVGTPVTLSAAGLTAPIDVRAYAYVAFEVTNAGASTPNYWNVTGYGDPAT